MKIRIQKLLAALALCSMLNLQPSNAFAQGTAFTYQGRLNSGGAPANGSYDLQFTLFGTNAGGVAIAGPVTNAAVAVNNGLFTTAIDFGPGVFTGESNWLQIAVSTNAANTFTNLAPRQQLTPVPYSIFANTASNVSGTVSSSQISGLIPTTQLTGTIPLAQLPAIVVTNGASGVDISGTFSGNGANVTNINLRSVGPAGMFSFIPNYFGPAVSYSVGNGPVCVAAADVNGDGMPDLITANFYTNTVTVLTNNGSGVFGFNATYTAGAVGSQPSSVLIVTNIDGHGLMAMAVTENNFGVVEVWTNDGSGVFGSNATYTVGSDPSTVVTADVNGDGAPDLITANFFDNTLTVLTNNGSGIFGFNATYHVGNGPSCVIVVTNLDGHGLMALVTANAYNGNTVTVLTNNGGGVFGFNATCTVGNGPASVAAGDINGDGRPDLITANQVDGTVTVLTNNGSGVFGFNATYTVGSGAASVAAADINGDGKLDLIAANEGTFASGFYLGGNTLSVLTNNGSGIFSPYATLVVGAEPRYVIATDVNGDGVADLICADNIFPPYDPGALSVVLNVPKLVVANAVVLTNSADVFDGNGAGLTSLNASQLVSGTVPLAVLPAAVITNNETGVTITVSNLSVSATNQIAPLTISPRIPSAAIGSRNTGGGDPVSVAVAGRYAYAVSFGLLQIFDVSSPTNPVSVGSVGTGSGPESVAVAGRYAYVANSGANTLQIFDVGNPASPVSVASVGTGTVPWSVAVAGRYAYVADYGGGTLQIFDVGNPASPVSVASVGTGGNPQSVTVAGRYAYVANYTGSTLQIFDVGNPASPVSMGSLSLGPTAQPDSVAVSGRYAYVANSFSNTLQVIDVSNPASPVSVGIFGTGSNPNSAVVAGRYVYVVNSISSTLQIIDVSSPASPVSVGTVGTGSYPDSVAVSGRYAYVVNGTASTLQVFDLGGEYVQQLEAGAVEVGTLQTRDTVTVGNSLNVRGGLTVSASARISGGLGADSITATNYTGNGGGLTNLNASQLASGTIPLAQLPSVVVTNNATSLTLSGTLSGNGGGLTNLNAATLGGSQLAAVSGAGLELGTNFYLMNNPLYLRSDQNHGLAYNGQTVTNFGSGQFQVDGPVLWGYTGGILGVVNGGVPHASLSWNSSLVTISNDLNVVGSQSGGFGTPLVLMTNGNTSGSTAPTLRTIGTGNSPNGVLSVSSQGTGLLAQFGNAFSFVADITTNGTVDAAAFNGGTLRVGGSGTTITNLEAGQAIMPASSLQGTNFTITFPTTFSSPPKVIASLSGDTNSIFANASDTFAMSIRAITNTASFTINVFRVDTAGGWSQQLRVNWQAWQ